MASTERGATRPPGSPGGVPRRDASAARRILAAAPFRDRFYFDNPLHRENVGRALAALGDLSGRRVLDYGSGARALTTALLAVAARKVVALDADLAALRRLRGMLPEEARARVIAVVSDGHATALRDGSFDAVFGLGILHHLDLRRALDEIERILRPGGAAAFVEPLGHNSLINLFRRLTPWMRDPDERPLMLSDLEAIAARSDAFEHRESQLLSLAALALRSIPVAGEALFRLVIRPLAPFDRWALRTFPALGRFAWTTVITWRRRPRASDAGR